MPVEVQFWNRVGKTILQTQEEKHRPDTGWKTHTRSVLTPREKESLGWRKLFDTVVPDIESIRRLVPRMPHRPLDLDAGSVSTVGAKLCS